MSRWLCLVAMTWGCAGTARGQDDGAAAAPPSVQAGEDIPAAAATPEVAKPTGKGTSVLSEVVVEAKKPLSSASSDEVREKDYKVRPHATMMEIVNNIPGLVVAQHQGGGKAPQWLMRGFDADHGTDVAVFADNLPVNLVTHGHGQGYADINFIIPETIERFQLWKGPYFAQFGDFANAGAINFVTKEQFDENFALAEGGYFGTQRYVLGVSPRLSWAKTLLAGQAYFTDGPFIHPQNYSRYNLFGKLTLDPTPESTLWVSGTVYDGDWHGSGQIPRRLVSADELKSDINVTPLVDVMLVLLVIFMVVTPLLKQQVPIELPIAEHSHDAQESAQVTLRAAADGTLVLDERPVAAAALDAALHDVYAGRPDKTIFLEADRSLPYSRVVDLMDACRAAGVERIGIVTKKTTADR